MRGDGIKVKMEEKMEITFKRKNNGIRRATFRKTDLKPRE
jgi:hypothetical protein